MKDKRPLALKPLKGFDQFEQHFKNKRKKERSDEELDEGP
jgi:hypothetical protein